MAGNRLQAILECGCCGEGVGDCVCGRPLGQTLTLRWSSGNGTHGSAPRIITLDYVQFEEDDISCPPYSPGPFPVYRGVVSGTFPLPMGGTREDSLEIVIVCGCIGCELCVYYRWLNGGFYPTWFLTSIIEQSCICPAVFRVGSFTDGEVWGYQVSDIEVYENPENCE